MQQRYPIIVLLAALMLLPITPSSGASYILQTEDLVFDPVSITTQLNTNGTTWLEFRAQVNNEGLNPVSAISVRIDSVQVYLDSSIVDGSVMPATLNIQERYSTITIQLDTPLTVDNSLWIHLILTMQDIQSEAGLTPDGEAILSDFIFYVRPISTYSNFSLTVILPPEATLSQQSVAPLFPQASSNYTDGLSIAFNWNIDNLQIGQEKVFIVRYQDPLDISTTVGFAGLELIIFGVGLFGLGLIFGYYGPRLLSKLREIGRVRIVGITSEEEEVMDTIRAKGGSCLQKDLYRDLDMSQAKVSLILTALEERGLVRRFKDGRENTVHIIEE